MKAIIVSPADHPASREAFSWRRERIPLKDRSGTLLRVCYSSHVSDLRWIVFIAAVGLLLTITVGLRLAFENQLVNHWKDLSQAQIRPWVELKYWLAAGSGFLPILVPTLAVFGAVVAWAYQAASKRLGVVDLFACEISTLCRIGSVLDTVRTLIGRFEQGPGGTSGAVNGSSERPFVSQEDYFPVFEGNSSDLQMLDACVVIHITAFYTYMKSMRDTMRLLAGIKPSAADLDCATDLRHIHAGPWHKTARDLIYLWFLGLESARHAITDLVEYQPEQAERLIVILLEELEAYRFLRSQFTDPHDRHTARILLRAKVYERIVPQLIQLVQAAHIDENPGASQWEPASVFLEDLRERYTAAGLGTHRRA